MFAEFLHLLDALENPILANPSFRLKGVLHQADDLYQPVWGHFHDNDQLAGHYPAYYMVTY